MMLSYIGFESTYKELKLVWDWQPVRFGKVLSLPIRNWNYAFNLVNICGYLVLSLPIRNWNTANSFVVPISNSRFESTYKELKHSPPKRTYNHQPGVLSLPIRNWNTASCKRFGSGIFVLSLPIRNWNTVYSVGTYIVLSCFESTYKELKYF